MFISKFSRISTTINPGFYSSVVYVSEGDGEGADPAEVATALEKDRDSLDMVAFDSEDGDVLDIKGFYKIVKQVKPKGMACMIVTEGKNPDMLDDLIGAGYADNVDFRMCGPVTSEQERSMELVKDNVCRFIVTVSLVPGMVDADVLRDIAEKTDGCRQFLMKSSDPRYGAKVYGKKELEALAKSVKGLAKHPVLM